MYIFASYIIKVNELILNIRIDHFLSNLHIFCYQVYDVQIFKRKSVHEGTVNYSHYFTN